MTAPAAPAPADPDADRPRIVAVASNGSHDFSKSAQAAITLQAGLGVAGDAHCGERVQHRSRVARDPTQPNLRQVHLIHAELFDELARAGFAIGPADLGENITTRGVDLLDLPTGTRLQLGPRAVVEVTGLRNPCVQIERFRRGLLGAVRTRTPDGHIVRKTGVMGIVISGGEVRPGDPIEIVRPPAPHRSLQPV